MTEQPQQPAGLLAKNGSAPAMTDAPAPGAAPIPGPNTSAPNTNAPNTNAPNTNAPNTNAPNTKAPNTNAPIPSPAQIVETANRIATAVGASVVGNFAALKISLAAILAGGHVLFEDNPGLGKTLLARSLAGALGLDFRRLQFTPDLLPADITGSYLYHPGESEFRFQPGPVFTGLLLADELNRTPPKTQSALLEAMQEGQVSVEGTTHQLPKPFHVIATANQIEYEGTYALPEAQLDRFLIRSRLGYPEPDAEREMLRRRVSRQSGDQPVAQVTTPETLLAMQAGVERVEVDPDIIAYCVSLARASRTHGAVEVGISPRGTQALLLLARAWAALDGRTFVIPEDVKAVAIPALGHRLVLRLKAYTDSVSGEQVVSQLLASVPTPPTRRGIDAGIGASIQAGPGGPHAGPGGPPLGSYPSGPAGPQGPPAGFPLAAGGPNSQLGRPLQPGPAPTWQPGSPAGR